MEKSKSRPLGVQKKQITKKKKLFSNVLNYLKSDSYMFAPLLSPLSGPKSKEHIKENKKMKMKMVGEYMYSPLLSSSSKPTASLPSEQIQCSREVTAEKQPCKDAPPAALGRGETVKHVVYHQRRRCLTPVSAEGKAMADMQLRKLAVE